MNKRSFYTLLFISFTILMLFNMALVVSAAPPVPQNDNYNTPYETTLTTNRENGVLANDSDPEGDPLRVVIVSTPSNSATFSLAADGSFSYTPRQGFIGTDSFTYAVIDDTEQGDPPEATVTIRVNPIAVADLYETAFEKPITVAAPGVLMNDRPMNNASFQAVLFATPAFGTVALSANGGFTYTPRDGFSGIDTFSYRIQIAQNTSPAAIVTISVAQNPEATANDDTYDTDFGTRLDVSAENGVLANDDDANNDALTAKLVDPPESGSVTLQASGAFSYTPQSNFYGADSFTYVANDGNTDSNAATVQINVRSPRPRNLSIIGNLTQGVVRPTFLWETATDANGGFVPAAWYNLVVKKGSSVVLNEWFEAASICSGNNCAVKITPSISIAGFTNGAHTWTVQAWNNNIFSTVSIPSAFTVNVPLPQTPSGFTVTSTLGRPIIGFPNDPNTSWVHVYIGESGGDIVEFEWYNKETEGEGQPIRCDADHCELVPDANPLNGVYEVWMQVWGPGGFNGDSAGIWSGPRDFSLEFGDSGLLGGLLTATADATSASFSWAAKPGISWYQIWVGTDVAFNQVYFDWHSAYDLDCRSGTCKLDIDVALSPGGNYTWFLRGWGPGGFTNGGPFDGWTKGNNFSP